MRRIVVAAAAVGVLLGLGGAAGAASLRAPLDYGGIYAFGDSLTDTGNAYSLTFGQVPPPPYWEGRFSDGPIWYDEVGAVFREQGLETRNYAIGGAKARRDWDGIPDLPDQVWVYRNRTEPRPDPLVALWAGGNDLRERIGSGSLTRVAREAADQLTAAAASLWRSGVDTALVFNLPDFADIPAYVGADEALRAQATLGTLTFNTRLDEGMAGLRGLGMEVLKVDTFALFKQVVADPAAYGITNLTQPCFVGGVDVCGPELRAQSAFVDSIHPSSTLHGVLAEHVLDMIAPKLPAEEPAGTPSETLVGTPVDTGLDLPPLLAGLLGEGGGEGVATAGLAGASGASTEVAPVPVPAPAALLVAALAALGAARRFGACRARPAAVND
jgi:phospholipase/lecithinase/hemolysin